MSNLYIMHYGVGHDKGGHSGRYPWGSGENPYGGTKKITKKDAKRLIKTSGKYFKQSTGSTTDQLNWAFSTQLIGDVAKRPSLAGLDPNEGWTDEKVKQAADYLWHNFKNFRENVEDYYNNYRRNQIAGREYVRNFAKEYDIKDLYDLKSINPDWKMAKEFVHAVITGASDVEYSVNMPESAYEWVKKTLQEQVQPLIDLNKSFQED